MFKRLSVKISAYIVLVLLIVVGTAIAIYTANCKSLYVTKEKSLMSKAYKQVMKCDFSNEKLKIDRIIAKYEDQVYNLQICREDGKSVYTTKRPRRTNRIIENKIVGHESEFYYDAVPVYENPPSGSEKIALRRLVSQNDKTYYLYIEESLKTVDSVFGYSNKFLLYMIALFIVVSAVAVFLLVNKITKSARKLSRVAGEIAEKNYSVRYAEKITSDEIGVLAENVNNMADTIQENINNLNNYNFLLKEDNNRMSEYENMRKRVLCNVTHELKTPLAIISSQVEMIKCSADEDKKEYYYESAMEEIDKMSKLISRLLNFSAGEREIFKAQQQTVDLSQKINELFETISLICDTKKVRLEKNIESGCVLSIAPNHIEHIFNNYIMNAVQHVKSGGRLSVSLKKRDEGFRLTVYNDGEGIDEENKEKIWTDFYKSGTASQGARSGLGLFIIKEISLIDRAECGVNNTADGVEFWYDFIIPNN